MGLLSTAIVTQQLLQRVLNKNNADGDEVDLGRAKLMMMMKQRVKPQLGY